MNEIRHKPGTAYVCDARVFGGDKRLCPIHRKTGDMLVLLESIANDTRHITIQDDNTGHNASYRDMAKAILASIDGARM